MKHERFQYKSMSSVASELLIIILRGTNIGTNQFHGHPSVRYACSLTVRHRLELIHMYLFIATYTTYIYIHDRSLYVRILLILNFHVSTHAQNFCLLELFQLKYLTVCVRLQDGKLTTECIVHDLCRTCITYIFR